MIDSFSTIDKPSEGLYKEKGSKFIALAFPVDDELQIKEIIARVKKEHFSARHWCYAWCLGPGKEVFRSNDDGEPSGTAGRPILNQINAAGITNVLIVVVRYFGGTLLGTSGLITAYKSAAADALQQAAISTRYITKEYVARFNSVETAEVMRRLKEFEAVIKKHDFSSVNEITFSIRLSYAEKLLSLIKQKNIQCQLKEL